MAGPALTIDTDKKSCLRLHDQIDVLTMKPVQRRRLLREIGKETRADVRKNVRQQQTVTGSAMAPRASKKKRRMFRKMAKGMVTRIRGDHQAIVTWKNTGQAKVAYQHQHGISENFTAQKAKRKYGVPDYSTPATPAQAKALNREGFRKRVARKRGKGGAILKRAPQKWIRDNMSLGQAGLVLRLMRTNTRKGKQSWKIDLPERPILGATPGDANTYLTTMAQEALAKIRKV
jgi:hypothetical protein